MKALHSQNISLSWLNTQALERYEIHSGQRGVLAVVYSLLNIVYTLRWKAETQWRMLGSPKKEKQKLFLVQVWHKTLDQGKRKFAKGNLQAEREARISPFFSDQMNRVCLELAGQ
jgi:hypothetical protein